MPLKCCVTGCVSNYAQLKRPTSESNSRKADETDNLPHNKRREANSGHIPIFKFPKNDSDKGIIHTLRGFKSLIHLLLVEKEWEYVLQGRIQFCLHVKK